MKEKRKADSELETLATKKAKKTDFIDAVLLNDIECVGYLMNDDSIDPAAENNLALRCACEEGHVQMVKLLLTDPRVQPTLETEKPDTEEIVNPLVAACQYGHINVAKLLLADSRVKPEVNSNQALRFAIVSGFAEIVELLLQDPSVDPSGDECLFYAVQEGSADIVKILLSDERIKLELSVPNQSNHSEYLSELCKLALQNNNQEILELLLAYSTGPVSLEKVLLNCEYPQIKFAMNCNKFGLFSEVLNLQKSGNRIGDFTLRNLANEVANAYNTTMKK